MRLIFSLCILCFVQMSFAQKACFDAANKYRFDDLMKDSVKANYPFDSLTAYIKRAQAMTINCQLPNDTFTTIKGKHSSLHKLKGKVLIIDFWSVYCIPCINAFPSFNALLKKYNGKLEVLGVTLDMKDKVLSLLEKHEFNAGIVADARKFFENYSLGSGYPLTMLVDTKGRVIHYRSGVAQELEDPMEVFNELSPLIDKVLKQK
ncbi:MAG: TlpA family protein disulfide reductase [Bacteroidia bacterium]